MSSKRFSKPRATSAAGLVAGLLVTAMVAAGPAPAPTVEILTATGGLPAHIAGRFQEPIGFGMTPAGEYVVLDRRAHTVYAVDRARRDLRQVIRIGFEEGKLLGPAVLALGPDDIVAVADGPHGAERIQYFGLDGTFLGGFHLGRVRTPGMAVGPFRVNGIDSMAFTGRSFLVSRPALGALFTEYELSGTIRRHVGTLRATGQESDPEVHQALNGGLPLVDPTGGFYFVFHSGRPMFRKYTADGQLAFERHIEGPELDRFINALPTEWPSPRARSERRPVVEPLIRAAAVDPAGRLWISLGEPYTYVYDPAGEKVRTIQFRAAGLVAPTSLFFAADGRLLVTPGCYEFRTSPE
ncbi:MAG TPA: hypothetical protein VMM93_05755 [Vicinamibacterales bacterium]|nr:hypothetical protein [Vicinamibacterales bacterium]